MYLNFVPNFPILILTAATPKARCQTKHKGSISMPNVITVEADPKRENVFHKFLPRATPRDDKLLDVIEAFALDLKENFHAKIFYSSLERYGECYSHFELNLADVSSILLSPANFTKNLPTLALRWCNLFPPDKKLPLQTALGLHCLFCRMQSELKTS